MKQINSWKEFENDDWRKEAFKGFDLKTYILLTLTHTPAYIKLKEHIWNTDNDLKKDLEYLKEHHPFIYHNRLFILDNFNINQYRESLEQSTSYKLKQLFKEKYVNEFVCDFYSIEISEFVHLLWVNGVEPKYFKDSSFIQEQNEWVEYRMKVYNKYGKFY